MLEQEIKFTAGSAGHLEKAVNSEFLQSYVTSSSESVRFLARYHDTSDRTLQQLKCSLRSRLEGEVFRATFKEKGSIMQGLSQHIEFEAEINDWLVNAGMLPAGACRDRVLQLIEIDEQLETVVTVDMQRRQFNLNIDSAAIECVADFGKILANKKELQLYELELELKQGNLEAMQVLGEKLRIEQNLVWSTKTKYALGLELWKS